MVLLSGRKVILHIEGLPNPFCRLALDHGNRLAADVKQLLDDHVVNGKDDLEGNLLVDFNGVLIPCFDIRRPLAAVALVVVLCRHRVVLAGFAPFEDFLEVRSRYLLRRLVEV